MAKKPAPPAEPTFQLRIVGPKEGFRRAGRSFGPEAVVIPNTELTEDQMQQLLDEPRLIVVEEPYVAPAAPEAQSPAA